MNGNGTNTIQPPYSQEAEEAVLGAVLVDPGQYKVLAARLTEDDFFFLKHGYIWKAIGELDKAGQPLDYLTLCVRLEQMGLMQTVGGPPFITELSYKTPTSQHAQVYAGLVRRACVRRQMLAAADSWKALALDEQLSLEQVSSKAQELFLNVQSRTVEVREQSMIPTVGGFLDRLHERVDRGMNAVGIPTGLTDLDELIGGLEKQRLYVVAGRPGAGKSAYIVCLALAAAKAGARVQVFLQEMSIDETMERVFAIESGVSAWQQRHAASITPDQLQRITDAAGPLSQLKIWWSDLPITPAEMEARCIYRKRCDGLDLVISDGLYRQPPNKPANNSYERVSQLARDNKNMAKLLNLPVVVTHQLDRAVDDRKDKRPILSDLRDSGVVEEEADVVVFLYRDVIYNEATEIPNQCDFIVAKNRGGATGTVPAYFEKSLTRFSNAAAQRVNLGDDKVIPMPKPATKTQAAMSAPGE